METTDTKDRILGYLLDKFLTGPARLDTVDEWARDLGMSKKTIYKHFDGKEQLLTELFTLMLQRQRAVILSIQTGQGSSISKFYEFIQHFKLVLDYVPGGLILELEKHYRLIFAQWENYKADFIDSAFGGFIEGGKAEGHIIGKLNTAFLSTFWENSVRNLLIQKPYLTIMTASDAFDELRDLFLRGISTTEGLAELRRMGAIK